MRATRLTCHTPRHKWMLQQNQLCPTQPHVLYKLEIGRLGALGFNIVTDNRTAEIHVEANDQQKPTDQVENRSLFSKFNLNFDFHLVNNDTGLLE